MPEVKWAKASLGQGITDGEIVAAVMKIGQHCWRVQTTPPQQGADSYGNDRAFIVSSRFNIADCVIGSLLRMRMTPKARIAPTTAIGLRGNVVSGIAKVCGFMGVLGGCNPCNGCFNVEELSSRTCKFAACRAEYSNLSSDLKRLHQVLHRQVSRLLAFQNRFHDCG